MTEMIEISIPVYLLWMLVVWIGLDALRVLLKSVEYIYSMMLSKQIARDIVIKLRPKNDG